ncbi:MAG: NUDIX domain-containing protein [Rhodothermales bacterium]
MSPAALTVRVVDVYLYREQSDTVEFLLLRRAPDVTYARQWRMVGGKIQPGEAAWQTALREVQEETGHALPNLWTVPSVNLFYEASADRVNVIPAFAASLPGDPTLNHEHDAFAWLSPADAIPCLRWPEQRRLLRLTAELLREGVLSEWWVAPLS